jgi:hypothetical protein
LQNFKPVDAYACAESIFDLPFSKKSFDSIMYFGLKQNMDQQHARLLLCDAARVVKPNGIVLLSVGQLSAGAASVIGPAWTRGEIEKPAGERDMGDWTSTFYTTEQQQRLRVDQFGVPLLDSNGVPLQSFLNSDWLKGAATSCGFEVQSLVPAKSFTGLVLVRFTVDWMHMFDFLCHLTIEISLQFRNLSSEKTNPETQKTERKFKNCQSCCQFCETVRF